MSFPIYPELRISFNIEDPERRGERIEEAKMLKEEERKLGEEYDSGKIDQITFEAKYFFDYLRKESRFETRCALESIGLPYSELGQIAEEYDILLTADPDLIDVNDRTNEFVKDNPEYAQEVADRMYEEGRMSEDTHDFISEKVRRYK